MSKTISEIYNRVINHAISLGLDADQFLSCWREGDWAGCREFGFEPDIECINEGSITEKDLKEPVATEAEASAPSSCVKPIDEQVLEALKESTSALFYLVEAKHGPKIASEYPEIVASRAVIAAAVLAKNGG